MENYNQLLLALLQSRVRVKTLQYIYANDEQQRFQAKLIFIEIEELTMQIADLNKLAEEEEENERELFREHLRETNEKIEEAKKSVWVARGYVTLSDVTKHKEYTVKNVLRDKYEYTNDKGELCVLDWFNLMKEFYPKPSGK